MKLKKLLSMLIPAAVLGLFATGAFAGATGTEFQTLYQWLYDVVTGYGGRALAFGFLIVGLLLGIMRGSLMMGLGGVGAAIFLFYLPTVMNSILSAVI
jgi:conjugal transfer pilus assembly protein TraA